MMDELQQKDINYLQKEFDRLEGTMKEGFSKLESRLEILSENYCTKDDLDKVRKDFDKKLNDKADVWVEKALSWAGYTIMGLIIVALISQIIK